MLRQGFQLLALAYYFFSEMVALGFGFEKKPTYTIGFAIAHWQGVAVLALALNWLDKLQGNIDKQANPPAFVTWLLRLLDRKR